MDADPDVWISLATEDGVFLVGERVSGEVRLRHLTRLARLVLRFRWRVRGSGEAAGDAHEIDVLAPFGDSPVGRRRYPFELPCGFDRMLDAPQGWYVDALFEVEASDNRRFEVVESIIVLPIEERGSEQAYR